MNYAKTALEMGLMCVHCLGGERVMSKEKILIVEDDTAIARGLMYNLEYEGYEVRNASHGQAALPMVRDFAPDLVILDLMLPGKSGFDILQELRFSGNNVYVIILSARTGESDKVEGLKTGADDYVAKPFSLRELLARVESAMRRIRLRKAAEDEEITFGDLTVAPGDHSATRNGVMLKLTPKAMEVLIFFVRHPHRTFSRDAIIEHLWHDDYEGTPRTIDNFVLQIRGQIEPDPTHPVRLETVHGQGYRFCG